MIGDNYIRSAKVRRVIDGDTIEVMFDVGFREFRVDRIRFLGINAPETKGESRESGLVTKEYVKSILPVDTEIVIQTQKSDAFDRWLGIIWYKNAEGIQVNLNEELLAKGLAIPFKG